MLALVVIVVAKGEDFTDEEIAALEEFREAGLLEADIEMLLENTSADEYYGDDLIEYDHDEFKDQGLIPDEASDRGGPRRRFIYLF